MIEPSLFSLASTPEADLERTGGLDVAVDETFATATRTQLDETSWVEHVPGWLAGDAELMVVLIKQASWDQRSRWMYTTKTAPAGTPTRLSLNFSIAFPAQ